MPRVCFTVGRDIRFTMPLDSVASFTQLNTDKFSDTRFTNWIAVMKKQTPGSFSMHSTSPSWTLKPPKVIVVRSNDTDVFVLLIHHATQINAKLRMDAGVSSKNTRRYIDINAIAQKITPSVCLALPSFHAFTGCDYTSSFFRKA